MWLANTAPTLRDLPSVSSASAAGTGGMPSTMRAEFGCTLCGAAGGPLGAFCASVEHVTNMNDRKVSLRLMALLDANVLPEDEKICSYARPATGAGPPS